MRSSVFQLRAVAVTPRCRSRCEYDRRSALMPSGAQTYASVPSTWEDFWAVVGLDEFADGVGGWCF